MSIYFYGIFCWLYNYNMEENWALGTPEPTDIILF